MSVKANVACTRVNRVARFCSLARVLNCTYHYRHYNILVKGASLEPLVPPIFTRDTIKHLRNTGWVMVSTCGSIETAFHYLRVAFAMAIAHIRQGFQRCSANKVDEQ